MPASWVRARSLVRSCRFSRSSTRYTFSASPERLPTNVRQFSSGGSNRTCALSASPSTRATRRSRSIRSMCSITAAPSVRRDEPLAVDQSGCAAVVDEQPVLDGARNPAGARVVGVGLEVEAPARLRLLGQDAFQSLDRPLVELTRLRRQVEMAPVATELPAQAVRLIRATRLAPHPPGT